jgi:hypothetical protein
MRRNFTFLASLVISVTLSAQKTKVEDLLPGNAVSRAEMHFYRTFNKDKPVKDLEHEFHVESGNPRSGLQGEGNPFPGLDIDQETRSTVAAKQRLDSIVSSKKRTIYEYDANGNTKSMVEDVWDTIGNRWMHNLKEEYTYDANGREIMDAGYQWVDSLQQWVGKWKTEITRDESGRTTLQEYYDWDPDEGKWISAEKWEYAYDEEGNTHVMNSPTIIQIWRSMWLIYPEWNFQSIQIRQQNISRLNSVRMQKPQG